MGQEANTPQGDEVMGTGGEPKILRRESFPPTGGEWFMRDDGLIEYTLGPKVEEHKHANAEAHWSVDLLEEEKTKNPNGVWSVIANLDRLPPHYNPPLELRVTYAKVLQDPKLHRIAIVHASKFHQLIVNTFLLTSASRKKLKFFDTEPEARVWVLSNDE